MSDAPAPANRTRVRTRQQLLHALNDDPRSVSREEIKAAFADGRLGDQDLDIPVLAGMRRITELLAELHPDDAAAHEAAAASEAATAAPAAPHSTGMSVRVTELEERITVLETAAAEPGPPSPTVQEVAELRTSIAHLETSLAAGDARQRQVMMIAVAALVIAIAAVILAVLVH